MATDILTGYPSVDKPWLKYYSENAIQAKMPECSAFEYIKEINKHRLGKVALNYYGHRITFREMFLKIDECAKALIAHGVKKGEIISVSLPNIPEAVYLFYAISQVGAVANMIDPRVNSEGIATYINETKSSKLFVIDTISDKIGSIIDKTALSTIIEVSPANSLPKHLHILFALKNKINGVKSNYVDWNTFINTGQNSINSHKFDCLSDAPVLIVHTGGTTGSPKGVVLTNNNINAIPFQSLQFPTDLQSKHIWLDIMPPFIAYGIGSGLHFPLAIGQEVVLIPTFKPEEFDKLILKYKPNHFAGTPSQWNYIVNSKKLAKKDLSFLITCCVGGDSMDEKLERRANQFLSDHNCEYSIAKGYGMTEVNGSIGRTTNENNPIGSVGIPFAHSVVKVCDPKSGEELKYNEIGEIYMTGPSVMMGYYDNPKETNNIKVKDDRGVSWIKSGDLGYMTEDGNLFIKNRIKRMIIRPDGFKVFPSTLEAAILKNENVLSCCVVGRRDKEQVQGDLPVAFVELGNTAESQETVQKELVESCKTELPEYAQPEDYYFIDKLPLTPFGKIDYRALEEIAKG